MDDIETAYGAPSHEFDEASEALPDSREQYTAGAFLRQFGVVVVVCLGLALLAQVLVQMVGES